MTPAKHPTPKGYRRLKAGEVVKPTGIMNACRNPLPFTALSNEGFIPAQFVVGDAVRSDWDFAVYRRLTFRQRIKNLFV